MTACFTVCRQEIISDSVEYMINAHCANAMVVAAEESVSAEKLEAIEISTCPTCGSFTGMFSANSMNSLPTLSL